MLEQTDVRALAAFFYFICLDPARAEHCASQAADQLEKLQKNDQKNKRLRSAEVRLILSAEQIYHKYQNLLSKAKATTEPLPLKDWILPQRFSTVLWRQFLKNSNSENQRALIWVHILNKRIVDVALASSCTEGTIRHRLGQALHDFCVAKKHDQNKDPNKLKVVRSDV